MSRSDFRCQACRNATLAELAGFTNLPRVTSDSKAFRAGGRLFICDDCGTVQKVADPQWLLDIGEIYRDYDMYHQSASNDQAVFDPVTGKPSGRCEVLARRLLETGYVKRAGKLLDVGAGSGAMLGAFSSACSGWTLFGLDLDDRKERALKAIPRFEQLYTVTPTQLNNRFNLITLIHSLEHFAEPLDLLVALREKFEPGGKLFIQVNNVNKQTFDLVVADHLCHFTPRSLGNMVARAGYTVEALSTDWVNKELSLLASPGSGNLRIPPTAQSNEARPRLERDVAWLTGMLAHASELVRSAPLAVFGTSVAATWLAGGLGGEVAFFVDEDPGREGRTHLGRRILKPSQVPAGTVVYLAFVAEVAAMIAQRLRGFPIKFVVPPA